jgi:hypothetical protein
MAGKSQRFLFLDSTAASFVRDSKFFFVFPRSIALGTPGSDIRCVVTNFTGFASQYNLNAYNNRLDLLIGGSSRTVSVDAGQYDTTSLAAWLNAQISEIDVTFDVDQVKFVLTSQSSFTVLGSSTILTVLGFPSGTTLTGTALQSTQLLNLAGPRFIEVQASLTNENIRNDQLSTLTLCRIPLAGYQMGDLVQYEPYPLGVSIKDHTLTYKPLEAFYSENNLALESKQ